MPTCIQDKMRKRRKPLFNRPRHDPIPDVVITTVKEVLKSVHDIHYGHLKWRTQLERRSENKLFETFLLKSIIHLYRLRIALRYSVRSVGFNGQRLSTRHVASTSSFITSVLTQQDLYNFIKGSAKLFGCRMWNSPVRRNRIHYIYYGH